MQKSDAVERAAENFRHAKVAYDRAVAEAEFKSSFGIPSKGYLFVYRDIEQGRVRKFGPVFFDYKTGVRYVDGQAGYGLGKDLFLDEIEIY